MNTRTTTVGSVAPAQTVEDVDGLVPTSVVDAPADQPTSLDRSPVSDPDHGATARRPAAPPRPHAWLSSSWVKILLVMLLGAIIFAVQVLALRAPTVPRSAPAFTGPAAEQPVDDPLLTTATGLTGTQVTSQPTFAEGTGVSIACPDGCATRSITVGNPGAVIKSLFDAGFTNEAGSKTACLRDAVEAGCIVSDGETVGLLTVPASTQDEITITRVDDDL